MDYIIILILLFFAILNVVLFFKVWHMTDNVQRIYEILQYRIAPDSSAVASKATGTATPDDIMVNDFFKDAKELRHTLLSANDDGQAERIFNEQISYIAGKYQSLAESRRLNVDFTILTKGLWERLAQATD